MNRLTNASISRFPRLTISLFMLALIGSAASGGQLVTVAGTGKPENSGDAGGALETNVGQPFGVEIGPDGALYITEVQNHRVRRLDFQTRQITTVAGCGRKGYSGDGGLAKEAELNEPYEVRFDAQGNMYFVEMQNHLVRRVDAKSHTISTVAGTGQAGYAGDGGPAIKARFQQPHSIALDGHGGLYVADIGNHRIRRVDLAAGTVESFAGSGEKSLPVDGRSAKGQPVLGPRALFVERGTMWVALREGHSVWRIDMDQSIWHAVAGSGKRGFSGDGGAASEATFDGPKGISVGPDKRVYIVDTENNAIRRVDVNTGKIETIFGGPSVAEKGTAKNSSSIRMNRPHGICVGPDGAVYVGDTNNHRVLRWTP